jgi:uncharacterized protein
VYVVDIDRGHSTGATGEVDTTWALVWHFNESGKVDRSSTCPVISIRLTR